MKVVVRGPRLVPVLVALAAVVVGAGFDDMATAALAARDAAADYSVCGNDVWSIK